MTDEMSATDRELRDTFGVTDEGIEELNKRAILRKERERLHPVPVGKGRAGSKPTTEGK
jgi:hypothetical protein